MKKSRIFLLVLLVIAMLGLAGCACVHDETITVNALDASCTVDGYTGDTQCKKCNQIIQKGEALPATGHTPGELTDAVQATCTEEGYSGDHYCTVCKELLEKGEAVAMLPHTPSELTGVKAASCTEEGYSGDIVCTVCGAMMTPGQTTSALGHTLGEKVNNAEATCTQEGYTGDVYCTVCGETLEKGEAIPTLPHTPGEKVNGAEATCTQEGYTGDVYCTVCDTLISQGETVTMLPHTWGEKENFKAATCLLEGYSGDQTCVNCGYTEMGSATERLPHDFVNNICTVCGLRVAGLYNDGELVFDWQQLLENGLVTEEKISNGSGLICLDVSEQLKGTLVINDTVNIIGQYLDEGLLYGYSTFNNCKDITEVYIPSSVTVIGQEAFSESGIEAVHFAGEKLDQLGENAFCECKALKEITIPEGITTVPAWCFAGCANLEKVQLPSTIKLIEDIAFDGCAALTAIDLSEGLEEIGSHVFSGTSIKEITLPASLKAVDNLSHIATLETIDMSKCQVTSLYAAFTSDKNLRAVHLPKTLKSIGYLTFKKTKIETLVLPQGFKTITAGAMSAGQLTTLKTVVWPFSFTDDEQYFSREATPETIYYEGTEAQWDALIGKDAFPETTIVYNYNYEEGIE